MADAVGNIRDLAKSATVSIAAGRSISGASARFGFLKAFFTTWLKLDLTTLAAVLTIFNTLTGVWRILQSLGLQAYWYFTKLFTASISIASSDKLNGEIVAWIGAEVLERQATRILTAKTELVANHRWMYSRNTTTERNDLDHAKRVPVRYLPTFGTTWFIHERNIFMVKRIAPRAYGSQVPEEYASAPEGNEPLVVMVLGRSVEPIKRFLDMCRAYADKQRESFVTVHANQVNSHETWDTTILRPIRPMETVHFDEDTKAEIIADIEAYLDAKTRRFYTTRGIPYRRGYLLHGTPGTGKTSLTLALAGHFGLDLYLLHIPSVREDSELEKLFSALPPRCIVLLEDIDAVGMKRRAPMASNEDEEDEEAEEQGQQPYKMTSRCTLSGLLNVLDGVTSQEGRIVLMTSNHADRLDKALIRPGRIDRMISLGNISPRSAELMFLRMFTPDADSPPDASLEKNTLEELAVAFSAHIPDNMFTPAQLQGYLLNNRTSASSALQKIEAWVQDERAKMEEAEKRAKEAAEYRRQKKRETAAKAAAMAPEEREREEAAKEMMAMRKNDADIAALLAGI